MRAVALTGPDHVETIDVAEPGCRPDEVIVQVNGVGLCGSDLSVVSGKRDVPHLPWVIGHEGGGDIVAVGSEVRDRRVGDKVVIEPNYSDLTCAFCRSGHTSACLTRKVVGVDVPGILAERVAVPAEFTWVVPAGWPDARLACFEPLAVAHTAVGRARVPAGADCLVIGAGSQGQLVCQSLLAAGAQPFVIEPHPGRRDLALSLGAKRAEDHGSDRYPHVFETAGVPAVWETAVGALDRFGTLVVVGMNPQPVQLTTFDLVTRKLTIVGHHIYDHPQDFADTLESVTTGALTPEETVRGTFPVEEAAAALVAVRDVPGKTWIDLTGWHTR